jgi:hypothetical protein
MLIVVATLWHRYLQINNASAVGNDHHLEDSRWSHSWSAAVSIWCLITSSSMFAHRYSPVVVLIVSCSQTSCHHPSVFPSNKYKVCYSPAMAWP